MYSINVVLILKIIITFVYSIYDVSSYYGHWSRIFFVPQQILNDKFSEFQFHYGIDLDYQNKIVYYANRYQNCIEKFDISNNKKSHISGKCGKVGDTNGAINNALFNEPSSIVYYQYNKQSQQSQISSKNYLVKDNFCNITNSSCKLIPPYPTITINNIRIYPQTILFPTFNPNIQQYLYITDRMNHCIKRISIKLEIVQTIAGICGQPGFLNGPYGYNKLNKPTNIGINRRGVVFFFDEGNQYMRKINTDKSVETLLNGACKQYRNSRSIQGYQLKRIVCYENWIQTRTKNPAQQQAISISDLCLNHIMFC